ncbi:MAG TPA: redoxin domain-containing protein [Wenzhouxiangella sp.]|nr:redoxin domain-containing protein [Wenzhouxiangella sp.]
MARLRSPQEAPRVQLKDVDGKLIVFGQGKRTLLTFYRDPACPFCNLHLYRLTNQYGALERSGLRVVAVFAASPDEVRRFILARPRPFPVAAEPDHEAYQIYGIEASVTRKLLAVFRRPLQWFRGMARVGLAASLKTLGGVGTSNTMPADFLIDEKGRIVEAYYGKDAGDHISFERVDEFANQASARSCQDMQANRLAIMGSGPPCERIR